MPDLSPDENRNALMALDVQDCSTRHEDEEKPTELTLLGSQIHLAEALSSKRAKSR